jgi:hypothetical protein
MHRAEPPQPHQLSDAAGIFAAGLHRHDLERVAHMPRFQQLHHQAYRKRRVRFRSTPLADATSPQSEALAGSDVWRCGKFILSLMALRSKDVEGL